MSEQQFDELRKHILEKHPGSEIQMTPISGGARMIKITQVALPPGWNRQRADIVFVAPPGYPAAAPDCFWIEPSGFRLEGGGTPQNTNDSNPIPGDTIGGRTTTWFSWHVQGWNPNRNSLRGFFQLILNRLNPAR